MSAIGLISAVTIVIITCFLNILQHIASYCEQIEQAVEHFGNEAEIFAESKIYRNAVALCILQVWELAGKPAEEFHKQNPAVPWRQIKPMRNIAAHSYGSVEPETTWAIIMDDIPALKKYCCSIFCDPDKVES